ncbi:MAG: aldehyde dehydrogenase [Rubrobacter sp.]|nr:aldehyde dehydrogenase [Rubrobacter sp.]
MAEPFVGGEYVKGLGLGRLPVVDPATGEEVDSVPVCGEPEVDAAVRSAGEALPGWQALPAARRGEILGEVARAVMGARDELAGLLTSEQGKPLREARIEIRRFVHTLEHYAGLAKNIRGGYVPDLDEGAYGLILRRPVGVVGAIVPWNFPTTLLANKLGPALVAGNAVVAKPAETTPLTTLRIAGIMHEAGLPAGVFNVVTGEGPEVGEALVRHPDVRRVAFTGSTEVGRRIMELAGPQFKRVSVELGGSDPVIVCPDADVDAAVKGVNIGRFFNAGQACLAAKRVYVFDEVYDEFMEGLVKRVSRYELGDGLQKAEKPKIRMGPMNRTRYRDQVDSQLEEAVSRGARIVYQGEWSGSKGYFFPPTVIEGAPHDSRVVREETFGPLLPVFRVGDLDEALRLANDSRYGLGSSIWTRNIRWIHRAAQEIEAGMTWVNQLHYGYDELPFGGVKDSGVGREHGPEALEYYLESKSVVIGGLD